MAVAKMKLVSLTGTMEYLDRAIECCLAGDDFQIEPTSSLFHGDTDFIPLADENPYDKGYSKLNEAVMVARLKPLPDCGASLMTIEQINEYVESLSEKLGSLNKRIEMLTREIEQTGQSMEQFIHFKGLDLHLDEIFACEFIKVRFGRLPKEFYDKLNMYGDNPYVTMFPCTTDNEYVWGVYFAPISAAPEVDRIFQTLYWERLHIPDAVGTPEEAYDALATRQAELSDQLNQAKLELSDLWELEQLQCSKVLILLAQRKQAYDLRKYVARYHGSNIFFFAGWVPKNGVSEFEQRFTDVPSVDCEVSDPDEKDIKRAPPPSKLTNGSFFKPFEFFVSMYGLPGYREIDPTPFVAITYFLIFGLMFADLGQGLVLVVGGYLVWRRTGNKLAHIVSMCGFSSAFWGVIMGSVFGFETWLTPFWEFLGGKMGLPLDEGKPINIENAATVLSLIYAAIGFGAILLVLAMCLNVFSKFRQGKIGEALFSQNGIAGIIFYASVVAAVVGSLLLGVSIMSKAYMICLIILPLVLIFCQEPLGKLVEGKPNWFPKKPGGFIVENFFEFFEIMLSYVSNTVSFLRIGAFMLVHYGMMAVVFTLADFCPKGSFSYILVVVAGNIVVIGIEGLLAGIQALRLEFYELFSRFFSGTGRPFTSVGKYKAK